VIVVRRLRRDFEATEQDGERHTIQRIMPESIVVVPVVAARFLCRCRPRSVGNDEGAALG
jgi:hypothetical protein